MATLPAPDDDVEKILTGIMQKQSPLMKQARTQGMQQAQQAGLGNSTMGIQASQAAAYNAALPIASQQAQQGFQKGMQGSEFEQQSKMQGAEFAQQTGMQGAQFGHETGMQTRGFEHATTQAEADRKQQEHMAWYGNTLESNRMELAANLQNASASLQNQYEASQKAQDRQMQERLASMEISAADRERAMSSIAQSNAAWSASYAQIAGNENLPNDARMDSLRAIDSMRQHNQNLTTSLYRYTVPW